MRKLDGLWVITGLICTMLAGCGGELALDLTVTATHKDTCINGKSGVEVLEAKIVNKGPGTVVCGDETKPWVSTRRSLPLPNWVTPLPTANTKTLKPGEFIHPNLR